MISFRALVAGLEVAVPTNPVIILKKKMGRVIRPENHNSVVILVPPNPVVVFLSCVYVVEKGILRLDFVVWKE